jgi:autotransporter-associated beta strand protein
LNGTNTYSGGTDVWANTTVGNNSGLGATTSTVNIGHGATLTFSTLHPSIGTLTDSSQFNFNDGTGTINLDTNVVDLTINQTGNFNYSGQITGVSGGTSTAALIKNGGAQLTLLGNNSGQFTGDTTINAGSIAIGNGQATTATFSGNVALGVTTGNNAQLFFRPGSGQTLDYNGSISNINSGTGGVTLNGAGNATLSVTGSSNFTGPTNVNNGTLHITADDLWSNASSTNVNGGATLQVDGNQTLTNLGGFGNVVIANAAKTLTVNSANPTTLSGNVTGNGGLTKTGANTLTLGGANTYGGTTTISAGTLQIGNGASGSITSSSIVNNAALVFNRSNAYTYGGAISGSGNVTKQNTGNLTLTGTNSYAGVTNVNAGTLFVNGSLTSSAVNVGLGTTLGGSGILSNGATFQFGSHLAPGNSTGTLTFTHGLTLQNGAILDFQLGTTSDKVVVTGGTFSVPLASNSVTINLSNTGSFGPGSYTLFDFSTGSTTNGFVATDFALGTPIPGFSYNLALSSNTLVLTASAIPEPSTYAVIAGVLGLGFAVWRRRRTTAA